MLRKSAIAAVLLGLVLTLRGESEEPAPKKPGAEHAKLKALEGTWEVSGKASMMPGTEPMKGTGTMDNRLVLGGKYLQSSGRVDMGGFNSDLMATIGYNLYLKKYFYIFFIADTGGFVVSEGSFDKDGQVLTLEGAEELPDGQEMKVKVIIRLLGEDKHVMEWWFPGEDGKPFQAAEYTFTRKK